MLAFELLYIELFSSYVSSNFRAFVLSIVRITIKIRQRQWYIRYAHFTYVRNCVILNNKTENTNKFTAHNVLECVSAYAVAFFHFAILRYVVVN